VSASIRLRASSRIRCAHFPRALVPKALVSRTLVPRALVPRALGSHRRHCRRHWPANSIKSAGDLYIALMKMAGHPSRIHMRRRAHWHHARWKIWMEDLGCFKSSHTFSSSRLRRRMRLWRMPGGAQRRIRRAAIGPKRTICAVPVRNGGRNTLKSPQGATSGQFHE
jgi:hypothetical protein